MAAGNDVFLARVSSLKTNEFGERLLHKFPIGLRVEPSWRDNGDRQSPGQASTINWSVSWLNGRRSKPP